MNRKNVQPLRNNGVGWISVVGFLNGSRLTNTSEIDRYMNTLFIPKGKFKHPVAHKNASYLLIIVYYEAAAFCVVDQEMCDIICHLCDQVIAAFGRLCVGIRC